MKVKHLIGWILYFSILTSIVMLMGGCVTTELDQQIDNFKRMFPDRPGDCMIYAMKAKAKYDRLGIPSRFCHGYWKGEKHVWVEYEKEEDIWLVDDKGLGNIGYPRESYKYYELTWWGE